MNSIKNIVQDTYVAFKRNSELPTISFFMGNGSVTFPLLSSDSLTSFLEFIVTIFSKEPNILRLNGPLIVVGDLHGHILDLFRIFHLYGYPDTTKYLFLGDLIDRGEFSLETVLFILLAKFLYPDNVYIIRGNHEFPSMGQKFGFMDEILDVYPNTNIFSNFMNVFSHFPIGAMINNEILCIHAGLGPSITSISSIENVPKPLTYFDTPTESAILWSDPSDNVKGYVKSTRGLGYMYGSDVIKEFLKNNKLRCLIRGHECCDSGVQRHFDKSVITVFSASNYCGTTSNPSGVLLINEKCDIVPRVSVPIPYLKRSAISLSSIKRTVRVIKSTPQLKVHKVITDPPPAIINQKVRIKIPTGRRHPIQSLPPGVDTQVYY